MALARLAARQWAIFRLEQLVAMGLSSSAVRKRTAAGKLHRLYRGVYALVPRNLLTREGLRLAAVYACGPDAVLSHRSAAALHGLLPHGRARIDVTVPKRTAKPQAGIALHRSTTLAEADTTTVRNIPCTTVARTMLDLAETVNRRTAERVFDQAESMQVFDLRALEDQIARNSTRRAAGIVKAILAEHYAGTTLTRSELEERFLTIVREAGLPQPEVNAWILLDDGGTALLGDFVWRAERVVVETDGHETHGTRQAFERDRRNSRRLMVAGWQPMRTTWRQLAREPQEIVDAVATLARL